VHDDDDRCVSKERPLEGPEALKRGGWRNVLKSLNPKNPGPQPSTTDTFKSSEGLEGGKVDVLECGPTDTDGVTPGVPRSPPEAVKSEKGGLS